MPVGDLVDPEGCHLYLWATNNYLPAAFECIKAWGFEYITTITWMKDKVGLGQYYRGITEHCLFATTKKRLPYKIDGDKRCQGVTGFYEPKTIHSRKPIQMREMIEIVSYAPRIEHSKKPQEARERIVSLMGDLPRIELFARESHDDWDCWGNEV